MATPQGIHSVLAAYIQGQRELENVSNDKIRNENETAAVAQRQQALDQAHQHNLDALDLEKQRQDLETKQYAAAQALQIHNAKSAIVKNYIDNATRPPDAVDTEDANAQGEQPISIPGIGDLTLPNRNAVVAQQQSEDAASLKTKTDEAIRLNQDKDKGKQALAAAKEQSDAALAREKAKNALDLEKFKGGNKIDVAKLQQSAATGRANIQASIALKLQEMKGTTATDIANNKDATAKDIAEGRNTTAKDIAEGRNITARDIADAKKSVMKPKDAEATEALDAIQRAAADAKDLLDKTGYSYYQGPGGYLTDLSTKFQGGENDPTNAAIKTSIGTMRDLYKTLEAGKSLSANELKLLDTHIPDESHYNSPTETKVQLEYLLKSLEEMQNDIYSRYATTGASAAAPASKIAPAHIYYDTKGNIQPKGK